MSISVLIVDDQALVRAGFRVLLSAADDIEVIGEAEDGEQAVLLAKELSPDVVLMDIRMPVMDGLEAMRQIMGEDPYGPGTSDADSKVDSQVTKFPRPKILTLTTFDADEYVYEALRVGAAGFLLKDTDPAQLVEAVRVVAAGNSLLSPAVTRRLISEFAMRPEVRRAHPDELDALTERELEILGLVAQGLSNDEIATKLFISPATSKTHVSRVMMKLHARDRAQLVVMAYECGLVVPGGDTE